MLKRSGGSAKKRSAHAKTCFDKTVGGFGKPDRPAKTGDQQTGSGRTKPLRVDRKVKIPTTQKTPANDLINVAFRVLFSGPLNDEAKGAAQSKSLAFLRPPEQQLQFLPNFLKR